MRKLIIILLLLLSLPLFGTTYYVKNGGNDSNTGLSDAQAFAHHPWAKDWTGTVTLSAGDIVLMKRGDSWSYSQPTSTLAYMTIAQSGSAGSHITTKAYGDGALPKIEVTNVYPHYVIYGTAKSYATFDSLEVKHYTTDRDLGNKYGFVLTDVGGLPCHDMTITHCVIHNVAQYGIYISPNGYNMVVGDTTATSTADATHFSNNIYDCGLGGILFTGSNPSGLESHCWFYYNYIHDINTGGTETSGYGISIGVVPGSNGAPTYVTTKYNRVENVACWEGLDCHDGKYIYFLNNYVKNCYLLVGLQSAILGGLTPVLDSCIVDGNTFENPGDNPLGNYFLQVAGRKEGNRPTKVHISNNTFFYTSRPASTSWALNMSWVDGVTINNNHFYNGASGNAGEAIYLSRDESASRIKNVSIYKNLIEDWYRAIHLQPGAIDGDIDIYYNIFYCHGYSFYSSLTQAYGGGDISLYNNVFLTNPITAYPYVVEMRNSTIPAGSTITFKNNILGFSSANINARYFATPSTITGSLVLDNNIYYNSTLYTPFIYLGSLKTFTAWQGYGYDANSLNSTDPYFQNLGGSYSLYTDFDIQSTSSAINGGVDVDLTSDFVDSLIVGLPDIGAFEYYADDPAVDPIVLTTLQPYKTSATTGVSGGNVTSDGGGTVLARGVCWNTTGTPTTSDSKTTDGTGSGTYTSTLTGLSAGSIYYVRAYATNESGTVYGEQMTFRATILHKSGKVLFNKSGKILYVD